MNYEFEGKLLVFRVLIPLFFGVLFGLLPVRLGSKRMVVCVLSSLVLWGAFSVSEFGSRALLFRTDWIFDPAGSPPGWEAKEPWMHWVWAGPLVLSLWIALRWILVMWLRADGDLEPGSRPIRVVRMVGVIYWLSVIGWMSFSMFPAGEGYADQASWFRYLGVLTSVASVLNAVMLVERLEVAQSRWFRWAQVVQFGFVAVVVLQSYASLGEWVIFCGAFLSGAIATGRIGAGSHGAGSHGAHRHGTQGSCESGLGTHEGGLQCGLGSIMSFAAVAGLSLSQAYAWNPLPLWLLWLLATSPAIMAIADRGLARGGRGSLVQRLLGFWVLLLIYVGIVYFFVLRTEPQW